MESLMMNYCEDEEDFLPVTQISSTINNNNSQYMDLSHESSEEDMPMPDTTENILGEFGIFPHPPARVLSAADSTNDSLKNKVNDADDDGNDEGDDDDDVVVVSDDDDSSNDVISAIVISRVETVVEEPLENICSSSGVATTKGFSESSSGSEKVSVSSTSNKIEQEVSSQTRDEKPRPSAKEVSQNRNAKQVPKLRIFKCNLCPYSSMIRFGLKRHLLTHSNSKNLDKLKCVNCSYEAESKKSLLMHCVIKHKAASLTCPVCCRLVPLQLKNDHLLICKKRNQVFKCNGCDYKTIRQKSFLRHRKRCAKVKLTSNPIRSTLKLDSCKYCSYSTKLKTNLDAHNLRHTLYNQPIYRCSSCDFKSFKKIVSRHFNATHKGKLLENEGNNNFKKYIEESSSLESIKEKKNNGKGNKRAIFPCNMCSYIAVSDQNLLRHLKPHRVGNQPIYSCNKCDYKSFKNNLSRHSVLAHGVKYNFKDSIPEYEDENHKIPKYEEKNHKIPKDENKSRKISKYEDKILKIRKFEGNNDQTRKCKDNIHKVPKCEDKKHNILKNENKDHKIPKYEDKNHIILKYEDKYRSKYKCTLCSFSTSYVITFNYHKRVHAAGKRPLSVCSHCDYKGFKRTVARHSKKFHGIEINNREKKSVPKSPAKNKSIPNGPSVNILYVCEICDYSTKDKDTLINHKLIHSGLKKRTAKPTS